MHRESRFHAFQNLRSSTCGEKRPRSERNSPHVANFGFRGSDLAVSKDNFNVRLNSPARERFTKKQRGSERGRVTRDGPPSQSRTNERVSLWHGTMPSRAVIRCLKRPVVTLAREEDAAPILVWKKVPGLGTIHVVCPHDISFCVNTN